MGSDGYTFRGEKCPQRANVGLFPWCRRGRTPRGSTPGRISTGENLSQRESPDEGPTSKLSCHETKRLEQRGQSQTLQRRVSGNRSFRFTDSCPFEQITPERFVGSSEIILVTSSPTSPLPSTTFGSDLELLIEFPPHPESLKRFPSTSSHPSRGCSFSLFP